MNWYGKSAGVAPFVTPRLAVGGSMKNRPFLRKIARTSCTDWNRIHPNKPRGVVWGVTAVVRSNHAFAPIFSPG